MTSLPSIYSPRGCICYLPIPNPNPNPNVTSFRSGYSLLSKINNIQSRYNYLTKFYQFSYCQQRLNLNFYRSSSRTSFAPKSYFSRKRYSYINSRSYWRPLQGRMGIEFSGCRMRELGLLSMRHISLMLLLTMRMSLQDASFLMVEQCSEPRQSKINLRSGSSSSRIWLALDVGRVVKMTISQNCLIFLRKEKRQGLRETQNLLLPVPTSTSFSCSFLPTRCKRVCSSSTSSVFLLSLGEQLSTIFLFCISICEGILMIIAFFMATMVSLRCSTAVLLAPMSALTRCPVQQVFI